MHVLLLEPSLQFCFLQYFLPARLSEIPGKDHEVHRPRYTRGGYQKAFDSCVEERPAQSLSLRLAAPCVDLLPLCHEMHEHHPIANASPAEIVTFLMEQHGLRQSDLPEIGAQSVVSDILNGKRDLNARQIKRLCERFGVAAGAFL